MQAVGDPERLKTNPRPKWPVPQEIIEWQPSYVQRGARPWTASERLPCNNLLAQVVNAAGQFRLAVHMHAQRRACMQTKTGGIPHFVIRAQRGSNNLLPIDLVRFTVLYLLGLVLQVPWASLAVSGRQTGR